MKKEDPEKLFDEIVSFINESRALLAEGAMMELAGFEDRIQGLCEAVLDLSQEQRLLYAKELHKLLGNLTALGQEMAAQRDNIAEKILDLTQHKKAASAYRTTEASDNKKQD